jgi:hypothetical protein
MFGLLIFYLPKIKTGHAHRAHAWRRQKFCSFDQLTSVSLIHESGQRLENKQGGLLDSSLVVFLPINFRCASKMQCCCVIEDVFRIRDDPLPNAARGGAACFSVNSNQ